MSYRDDLTYKALEEIIRTAGVKIEYGAVHDDSIDGEIWARSDSDSKAILMAADNIYPDVSTACRILGHEMGHLMTGLESVDGDFTQREMNERTCDLIGAYLYKLAEMAAEYKAEQTLMGQLPLEG